MKITTEDIKTAEKVLNALIHDCEIMIDAEEKTVKKYPHAKQILKQLKRHRYGLKMSHEIVAYTLRRRGVEVE